jgi:hypothetical protein
MDNGQNRVASASAGEGVSSDQPFAGARLATARGTDTEQT